VGYSRLSHRRVTGSRAVNGQVIVRIPVKLRFGKRGGRRPLSQAVPDFSTAQKRRAELKKRVADIVLTLASSALSDPKGITHRRYSFDALRHAAPNLIVSPRPVHLLCERFKRATATLSVHSQQ